MAGQLVRLTITSKFKRRSSQIEMLKSVLIRRLRNDDLKVYSDDIRGRRKEHQRSTQGSDKETRSWGEERL